MYIRPLRRPTPPASPATPILQSWGDGPDAGGVGPKPADKSAPSHPVHEAEVKGLRQLLAEVEASRETLQQEIDDLRRDRDHWQNLAKSDAEKSAPRVWFCGRATGG